MTLTWRSPELAIDPERTLSALIASGEQRRHSASGIQLFRRCQRAWAYQYLDGLRIKDVPWDAIERGAPCTSRQRSFSLGTATHDALEHWYRGEDYDWSRLPGVIAQSGKHQLPHPEKCEVAEVEGELGELRIGGIDWNGRLDLVVSAPSEWSRLGIAVPQGSAPVVLIDHKTSSNVKRYAPPPAELVGMLQPNIYGLALLERFDAPRLPARWNYMQTGRTRKAEPRDFLIERSRAEDVLGEAAESAHQANMLTSSAEAPPNTMACGDYGGCEYHKSAGGPCDARRSVGGLIQARVRKQSEPMALSPELKAKLEKYGKKARAEEPETEEPETEEPETEEPEAEEPEAEEPEAEEPEAEEPEPEPKPERRTPRKPRGRSKASKKAPAAAKTAAVRAPAAAKTAARKPATGGTSLAEIAAAYEHALGEAEDLKAQLRELLGAE